MTVVALQLAGWFFPPLSFFSSAAIALCAFHYALPIAAAVLAAAGFAASGLIALLALVGGDGDALRAYMNALLLVALHWAPIFVFARVWRNASLSVAVQVLGVLAVVVLLAAHWSLDDLAELWREQMTGLMPFSVDELAPDGRAAFHHLTEIMTGVTISGATATWTLCAMFGRWMQRLQGERGRFRAEVAEMNMGVILAAFMAAATAMWVMRGGPLWLEIVIATAPLFFIQGVVTAHRLINLRVENRKPWLIGLYAGLFVSLWLDPRILTVIIVLGVLENFVKLRRRCLQIRRHDDEPPAS